MSEGESGEAFQERTRARRLAKLDALREQGIEPYPVRFDRDARAAELHERFADLAPGADSGVEVRLAGRLTGERRHGGLDFADLRDETGSVQLLVTREAVGEEALARFNDLDLGDWVGVTGTVVASQTGELTVRAGEFQLLSKALRALPDMRHGLNDPEDRYRRRYLDLIVDAPTRETFRIRSDVIATVRRVLHEKGFREVETPVLLSQAGGASAKPFVTHHNALDIDMYLRIALELPLKRLLVGGMDRVFEIGRVFRNEGLDTRHNPEFTLLEAYQSFGDYHDMMDLTEEIVSQSALHAIGTTIVEINGREVDLKPPWRRVTMADLIREHAGAEMHPSMPVEDAREIADRFGVVWLDVWGSGKIMAEVYDETCEDKLIEPTFVMDHPREVSPLARPHRDDPTLTERFEMVVAARELANAYSELNDPVDQAERFASEAKLQAGGDEEVEPVDDDYVEALEYGLPPTGGLGIGIDRLVMLIAGVESIRDVILFPTLRPLGSGGGGDGDAPAAPEPPIAPELERAPAMASAPIETVATAARPASLRPIALASVVVAILSLFPTVLAEHLDLRNLELLSRESRTASLVLSVAIALGLLGVARGLSRGKKRAWEISTGLFAAAAFVHLVRGPNPLACVLSLFMVGLLIWFRQDFRARSDPGSVRMALAFIPAYLVGVYAFTALSLISEHSHVSPGLDAGGIAETAYKGLIGVDGPYEYGRESFRAFFPDALVVLGIAGLGFLLYLLLRTYVQRRPADESRRAHAREIVRAYGADTLAYFALRKDKNYFFSSDGRSLIAYVYVRGHAMVAADPVGPPEDTAKTLDEFLAFCRDRGWRVAFLAVREADTPIYRERGMHSLYLGDEAILRCDRFNLEGSGMKAVRSAVRRIARDHTFELINEDEATPELVAELNAISAEWRDGAPERGFTMELGEEVEGTDPGFVIALAREHGGRVAGFLRFVPCFGADPGFSLDLMRRRPESANGLTEFLIANTALTLGPRGYKRLSLNFAAWGRLLDSAENESLGARIQRRIAKGLNPFFQIQSLRDFNEKFGPEWLPRSIVIDDVSDLPRVAVLYASVEGFLDIPVLGELFVPPVRQAAAAEKPPA